MKLAITALTVLLSTASLSAQDIPSAPQRRLDLSIKAFDVTARTLDVVSTHRFLTNGGGHETQLPPVIVNHPANMVLFEASVLLVETYGARQLAKHGHTRMARFIPLIDGAASMGQDIANFRIKPIPPHK